MSNHIGVRRRIDLLFGTVFLIAALRFIVVDLVTGSTWVETVFDSRFWLVAMISTIFFLGLQVPFFRQVQPFVFLLIAILPMLNNPESVFGFGLFAVGCLMLLVDGHLNRHRLLKIILLCLYFLVIVIVATIVSKAPAEGALGFFLFVGTFFLFMFLSFQDKLVVFVQSEKPSVQLSKQNLTPKEIEYLETLLSGKTMKEVAWTHRVRESTVRNSMSRIYAKIGVKDALGLIRWAEGRNIRP